MEFTKLKPIISSFAYNTKFELMDRSNSTVFSGTVGEFYESYRDSEYMERYVFNASITNNGMLVMVVWEEI